jgi:hypothetical protein
MTSWQKCHQIGSNSRSQESSLIPKVEPTNHPTRAARPSNQESNAIALYLGETTLRGPKKLRSPSLS